MEDSLPMSAYQFYDDASEGLALSEPPRKRRPATTLFDKMSSLTSDTSAGSLVLWSDTLDTAVLGGTVCTQRTCRTEVSTLPEGVPVGMSFRFPTPSFCDAKLCLRRFRRDLIIDLT